MSDETTAFARVPLWVVVVLGHLLVAAFGAARVLCLAGAHDDVYVSRYQVGDLDALQRLERVVALSVVAEILTSVGRKR